MTFGSLPRHERPRERLRALGPWALSDSELLAIVLGAGTGRRNAVQVASDLLAEFGGLQPMTAASHDRLCAANGIGTARWATLQAALEVARRAIGEELRQADALASPAAVRSFLRIWLRNRQHEVFVGLFLDSRNRLLAAEELFRGTLTQTAVYPREVVRRALELNAAGVIFAHNHPSGVAQASAADRALTDALRSALQLLEIPVLDHLIVAGPQCVSFAESGLL